MRTRYAIYRWPTIVLLLSVCCLPSLSRQFEKALVRIPINPKEAEVVDLESLADSIAVLKLENADEAIVGHVDRMLLTEERIYILSGRQNAKVDVFDMNGEFLYAILAMGQGPQEIERIGNIALDGDELLVYGDLQRKILRYSADGRLIEEHSINLFAQNFVKGKDGWLFLLQDYSRSEFQERHIVRTRPDFSASEPFFKPEETSLGMVFSYNRFLRADDKVLFGLPQNDTVFSVEGSSVQAQYFVDFGKYSMSDALRKRPYGRDIFEQLKKSNHARKNTRHLDAGTHFSFFYAKQNRNTRRDNRMRQVFFDKETARVSWHFYQLNLKRFGALLPFYNSFTYQDQMVISANFLELFQSNEKELEKKSRQGISEGHGWLSLEEAINVMKEEDNPYLFFYKVAKKE